MAKIIWYSTTDNHKNFYTNKICCHKTVISQAGIDISIGGMLKINETGKKELEKKIREIKKIILENYED